jgi:hypothetical protein
MRCTGANDRLPPTSVQAELEHLKAVRAAERAGRTRAEQELRKAQLAAVAAASTKDTSAASPHTQLIAYPFRPIGHVKSCFSTRWVDPVAVPCLQSSVAALVLTGTNRA